MMKTPVLTAKAVFDNAHEIGSPAERKAYLNQVCADSPDVRLKVEALLQAYQDAGSSFLKGPAFPLSQTGPYQAGADTPGPSSRVEPKTVDTLPPTDRPSRAEGPGTQIGPYRLVEMLGEGGMGAVYLAEQEQPIRRQVALKIIKPGMDSAQVVARFEVERQPEAALPWYGKAIVLLTPINPRPDSATVFLRNAHWDRANALGQIGQHAEAVLDWQQAIELEEGAATRDDLRLLQETARMEVKLKAQPKAADQGVSRKPGGRKGREGSARNEMTDLFKMGGTD